MFGIRKPIFDYLKILFETMDNAEKAYSWIYDEIKKHGRLSSKKLFDELEMLGNTAGSYNFGWKSMKHIHVERTVNGDNVLYLPYPKKIRPIKEDI